MLEKPYTQPAPTLQEALESLWNQVYQAYELGKVVYALQERNLPYSVEDVTRGLPDGLAYAMNRAYATIHENRIHPGKKG